MHILYTNLFSLLFLSGLLHYLLFQTIRNSFQFVTDGCTWVLELINVTFPWNEKENIITNVLLLL